MELTLPKTWFQMTNTARKRSSETNARGNKSDEGLHSSNFVQNYSGSNGYIKKLQHMTQNELISKILQLEENQVA